MSNEGVTCPQNAFTSEGPSDPWQRAVDQVAGAQSFSRALELAAERLAARGGWQAARMWSRTPGGSAFHCAREWRLDDGLRPADRTSPDPVAPSGILEVARRGRSAWVDPSGASERTSGIALPILDGEETVTILELFKGGPPARDPARIVDCETLRPILGLAYERDSLRQAVSRLEAALTSRQEELKQFVYVASHDLHEPLRKLQWFLQLLEERLGEAVDERGKKYLEHSRRAAQRMDALVKHLGRYALLTAAPLDIERVELASVLSEVLSDLQHRIERSGAQVSVGALPVIDADRQRMRQLFTNLLQNALKFHEPEAQPQVRIDAESPIAEAGATVEIRVLDRGIGVPEGREGDAFLPFCRVHDRREIEGHGLGLAICDKIVRAHGGRIAAKNRSDGGLAVTITLPARQEVNAT